jgi:hypothetical protein
MIPSSSDNLQSGGVPPALSPQPNPQSGSGRSLFANLLSLCLVLFLVDAVVSLADDSLIFLFGFHLLSALRGLTSFFALLMAAGVYVLIGLTPMVPKRLFLPIPAFTLVAIMAVFPVAIYCFGRYQLVSWSISVCQVIIGLWILYWSQGGFKFRWPLVPVDRLGARSFSWLNLSVFVLVNVLVLPPAVAAYLVVCSVLAVNHFTGGFLAVHPAGLAVQVREYTRSDGKTIELVPMAHVADASFYRKISQSFPSNSVILMEGVTDQKHLLTNQINYARMAHALHLSQQETQFEPTHGEMVDADVDVDQFSTNTINFMNLVMLFHSKGVNPATVQAALEYSPPPDFLDQLTQDLLRNRNRHLLEQIQTWLPRSDDLIIPWGVAHMPEISKEIQESGFHLVGTREYTLIRFHFSGNQRHAAGQGRGPGKSN